MALAIVDKDYVAELSHDRFAYKLPNFGYKSHLNHPEENDWLLSKLWLEAPLD